MVQLRSTFQGLRTFLTVWTGQICSLIGSAMTNFALGLWVYQQTNSITLFALISMFANLPQIFLSPFAGVVADRWDRRTIIMFSNIGAALITCLTLALYSLDMLSIGYIYFAAMSIATCSTFLRPALSSSTVLLVSKAQLGRANGLMQSGISTVQVIAPIVASLLLLVIGTQGILLIDFASYILAIGALLLVRFPQPPANANASSKKRSILRDMLFGWSYLSSNPGLISLLIFMALINIIFGISTVLITPLILSMSDTITLGTILSSGGVGMIAGSIALTVWGGPKRRMHGVLVFTFISALCTCISGLQPWPLLVGITTVIAYFCQPILGGCINIILQSKVEPSVQGRVFGVVIMVALSTQPIAFFLAGPISERVFKPLLTVDGPLASSVGQIIGVGPERGLGLMFVLLGLFGMILVIASALYPRLRLIEDETSDPVVNQVQAA